MKGPFDIAQSTYEAVQELSIVLEAAVIKGDLSQGKYQRLREQIVHDPVTGPIAPTWLKKYRDLGQLRRFMQNDITPDHQSTYAQRRTAIGDGLEPLYDALEPGAVSSTSSLSLSAELERLKNEFSDLPVRDDAERTRLTNELETVVRMALDSDAASRFVKQIRDVAFYPIAFVVPGPDHTPTTWRQGIAKMIGLIAAVEHHMALAKAPVHSPLSKTVEKGMTKDTLFLVHGQDQTILREVEAYVRRIGLNAIVLQDEASAGRTVIEKFESNAHVPYALIIFSADDLGRSATAPPASEKRRPRQNAVLELGFFMGRLGRENVCVLVDSALDADAEYPSDMAGIVTVHYRSGGDWKTLLIREFREAGLSFDESRT
jgi:predicted nucleotide-binding protein